jgi:MoaA/NifB/PqqE/SkfB family radical SAM enzyme
MTDLFLTGGEPFILHDIFGMIVYGLERIHVTVLSNGILLKGRRLDQLRTLSPRERLTIQISLDGSNAATHDFYRGSGSWQKAIAAIQRLKEEGFHVRLGTTQTPEIIRIWLPCASCIARLIFLMKITFFVPLSVGVSRPKVWLFRSQRSSRK